MFYLDYEFCHRHGYPLLIVHKGNNPYQPTIQFGDMSNRLFGHVLETMAGQFLGHKRVAQPMEVQLEGCL